MISVFDVTPTIDVDSVETEVMSILGRDAGEVIVLAGASPVKDALVEDVLSADGPVEEILAPLERAEAEKVLTGGMPMTAEVLVEEPSMVDEVAEMSESTEVADEDPVKADSLAELSVGRGTVVDELMKMMPEAEERVTKEPVGDNELVSEPLIGSPSEPIAPRL